MTTQKANRRLVSDLKRVVRDAEDLLKATADQTGEKLNEIRSRLTGALESAKATYESVQEKVQGEAVAAAKATDRVVRDHPYESIGTAFGLGLLIGVLVARW